MKIKQVKVSNIKNYKALPKKEREFLGFWYRKPYAYEWEGGSFFGSCKFEDYWKEKYPIQFRIRNFFYELDIWLSVKKRQFEENVWYKYFNKQNKWLRKATPYLWSDKTELIKDVLFAAVTDFIEVEVPKSYTDWSYEPQAEELKKVRQIYDDIHKTLPKLIKADEESTTEFINIYTDKTATKEQKDSAFKKSKEAEQAVYDFENDIMKRIIDNRMRLWT